MNNNTLKYLNTPQGVTFFSPAGEKKVTKETPFQVARPFSHSLEAEGKQASNTEA